MTDESTRKPSTAADRPRVLVDAMCGALARHLRMCGYDAAYALDRGVESDERLRALADDECRVLITRDRELAAAMDDAVLLTEREVIDQLRELDAAGFPVDLPVEPRHCGTCNGRVERVRDEPVADRPAYVPDDVDPVWRCRECGQWFWKGSHWEHLASRLERI